MDQVLTNCATLYTGECEQDKPLIGTGDSGICKSLRIWCSNSE